MPHRKLSRRRFLQHSTAAAAGAGAAAVAPGLFAARWFNGTAKLVESDRKMNIACVGVGGKGGVDVRGVSSENIVALCDVDFSRGAKSFQSHPDAKRYRDFRKMLQDVGDEIDAVTISTPDHMHFPIAMLAMQMGAPNSPQWFNTGLHWAYGIDGPGQGHTYVNFETGELTVSNSAYEHPQPHACFIQSIEDDLVNENGIMDLWVREARLFKYGSGTGSNFSKLRGANVICQVADDLPVS